MTLRSDPDRCCNRAVSTYVAARGTFPERARGVCKPYFLALKADLLARNTIILDEEVSAYFGTARAMAPLARLLAFKQSLRGRARDGAHAVLCLSHYAPK